MGYFLSLQYWIPQAVLIFLFWLARLPAQYLMMVALRRLRTVAEDIGGEEGAGFHQSVLLEIDTTPIGFLRYLVIRSAIRRGRLLILRMQAQQESENQPQEEQQQAQAPAPTPAHGARRRLRRPALPHWRPRKPINTRLITIFTAFGGSIIGGQQGRDFSEQWRAELKEVKHPVVRVAHAFSNMVSSFRIRWIVRTGPAAHRVFAAPLRLINATLDIIATHAPLSGLLLGGPVIATIVGIAYLINGLALAFPMAITTPPLITVPISKWRKRRMSRKAEIKTE